MALRPLDLRVVASREYPELHREPPRRDDRDDLRQAARYEPGLLGPRQPFPVLLRAVVRANLDYLGWFLVVVAAQVAISVAVMLALA